MIQSLQCPTCGAPLDYDPQTSGETVRCPFCANTAVIPHAARPAAAPQIIIRTGSFGRGVRRTAQGAFAGVLVLVLVILGFTGAIVFFVVRSVNRTVTTATRTVGVTNTRSTLATPPAKNSPWAGYTEPLMAFGAEGIGPGNFKDARSIAVDAQGRIYVGEYTGGRVQVFDSSGKFVTQWHNLFRPCGLYMHGTHQPIFFVGELGPFLAINRRYPNIGPRISILNHKGELLGRLGAPHAGTEDGTFIAPHTLAMNSRGDLYVGEVSYSAWDHVFPGAPQPRRIRSLQKLTRIV